jgi:hypothetical protein
MYTAGNNNNNSKTHNICWTCLFKYFSSTLHLISSNLILDAKKSLNTILTRIMNGIREAAASEVITAKGDTKIQFT